MGKPERLPKSVHEIAEVIGEVAALIHDPDAFQHWGIVRSCFVDIAQKQGGCPSDQPLECGIVVTYGGQYALVDELGQRYLHTGYPDCAHASPHLLREVTLALMVPEIGWVAGACTQACCAYP